MNLSTFEGELTLRGWPFINEVDKFATVICSQNSSILSG
ncbi:hypothetical protein EC178200_4495 [Escherichia coli 178200]|nr:hypothetical protein EC178200_4495 [Escherichia coli 178200]